SPEEHGRRWIAGRLPRLQGVHRRRPAARGHRRGHAHRLPAPSAHHLPRAGRRADRPGCLTMKRSGILHGELAARLASLGHTDAFLITDSGFPVPAGVSIIDLRLVYGIPRFAEVLSAVVADVVL